ncbi:ATP-binding protein [Goodfellowiella coeruleoviolacea]|uniref:Uncharacterized protein n=1 Tax=Goodfellowiella coeruleoviolacea TaxID=334858 RepID=A0AAE3GLQ6_9PSEU|nr:ATP-binding protein [Goodfellowiella coeruleoviolacea]MCP2169875.1 hypothetical protein [Goodfellowiella coeruleoviolacea]
MLSTVTTNDYPTILAAGVHDATPDPEAVYAQVAGRLSDLTGVRVEDITVEPDQVREVFTLFLHELDGLRLPARALSEGTLRFLALCVLLEDPTFTARHPRSHDRGVAAVGQRRSPDAGR